MEEYEEEMDRLLREADFAAENPGLKEHMWQRLQERVARRQQEPWKNIEEDRELSDEDLIHLAAAGNIRWQKTRDKSFRERKEQSWIKPKSKT